MENESDLKHPAVNNLNYEQIIIGGLQRSGTSLVRAMVGSHPDISIYQWDVGLLIDFFPKYGNRILNKNECHKLVNVILKNPKVEACDIKFDKSYFIDWIAKNQNEIRFSSVYMLFLNYYLNKTGRKHIGLKTPFNEFYADEIFDLFPKTKFIHVIRNPLDAAVSLKAAKRSWWNQSIDFSEHIKDWQKSASIALTNMEKYKGQYFVLKYEDLLSDPTTMAKKISEFLNVAYHINMVKLNGQPGWTGTNSSFENSDAEVFKTSTIDRYKNRLDKGVQLEYFYKLKDLLLKFDYEVPNKIYINNYRAYRIAKHAYNFANGSKGFVEYLLAVPAKIRFKLKVFGRKFS